MHTKILKISPINPDPKIVEQAAGIIRSGGLVAFPTETVYGLGANALDMVSVEKIFKAKNRPVDNPLIVHISEKEELKKIAKNIPETAWKLVDIFWPGPLTFILEKQEIIPPIVSGGTNNVAVRMPSHKVALELIKASCAPIAAPSANTSTRPSPTSASHVYDDLKGKIECILDAGEVAIGIESTVIDFILEVPLILRPGAITLEMLSRYLPNISNNKNISNSLTAHHSPGTKYKHYAPTCSVLLFIGDQKFALEKVINAYKEKADKGEKCWVVVQKEIDIIPLSDQQILLTAKDYAHNIFSIFRQAEKEGVTTILAQGLEEAGIGHAVMNRLRKVATIII